MIRTGAALISLLCAVLVGCMTGQPSFVHSTYDFSIVKKVAVLPLENLTTDPQASERVRKAVIAELLTTGVVDVIEPGQVNRVLTQANVQSVATLSTEDLKRLAATLGVQLLFLGSLDVYERVTVGGGTFGDVTVSLRAIDGQTGTIVWSATRTAGGAGVFGRLFGFGGDTLTDATQKTVRAALATLFR